MSDVHFVVLNSDGEEVDGLSIRDGFVPRPGEAVNLHLGKDWDGREYRVIGVSYRVRRSVDAFKETHERMTAMVEISPVRRFDAAALRGEETGGD